MRTDRLRELKETFRPDIAAEIREMATYSQFLSYSNTNPKQGRQRRHHCDAKKLHSSHDPPGVVDDGL